ncbi:MAG: Asp-tRNA(Asn)/Glu-tRNA(Gln) amidotransferase subunit GatB [Spirochaetales bacterium]|nr:Asp-tRNA(Asn)/Glu-tRNA(Gln) amidotransferase subunit GatB [Spirochaetales bacterium]
MKYDVIIGCEVHVQLLTRSKAFCSCPNNFGGAPNSRVCPRCLGLPGSLPVPNRDMISSAIKAGLALHCKIAELTKFDRKNYMYPDLPKAYQISQFDMPVCAGGYLEVTADGQSRKIGIIRVHMEEDAGKNIHAQGGLNMSYVDYNRAGTPLLEIVSEPDIRSAEEAVNYVQSLREIMRFLDVSDCNMEEGSLRCDANINLWIYEDEKRFATPIVEVKNMNSFKAMKSALEYEAERQLDEWREKHLTLQAVGKTTRGWNDDRGETVLQRMKEEAADYRYFPEPDIKPISISQNLIKQIKQSIPELPEQKRGRFVQDYGIAQEAAEALTQSKALCDYFEEAARGYQEPKRIANWILSEVKKLLNEKQMSIEQFPVPARQVTELLRIVDAGTISGKIAKDVFAEMAASRKSAAELVETKGLAQISDTGELEDVVEKIIRENPSTVADFKAGKQKALQHLMGQIMNATKGKANPQVTIRLIKAKISGN